MESIKNKLSYEFDKNNIYSCFYAKKSFINYWSEIIYKIINTKVKILDAVYALRKKTKIYKDIEENIFEKDFIQYISKYLLLLFDFPLEKIKERYTFDYDEVEERMYFRLELYSNGWEHYQIENYVYKHLLKRDFDFEWDNNLIAYYKMFINNISNYLNVKRKICSLKKGRPPLPLSLKKYIKDKHKLKVKLIMKDIYDKSKRFDSISEYLFTGDEVKYLGSVVKEETLLTKIKMLSNDFN